MDTPVTYRIVNGNIVCKALQPEPRYSAVSFSKEGKDTLVQLDISHLYTTLTEPQN